MQGHEQFHTLHESAANYITPEKHLEPGAGGKGSGGTGVPLACIFLWGNHHFVVEYLVRPFIITCPFLWI